MKTYFLRLRPSEEVTERLRALRKAFSRAVGLAWDVGYQKGCASRVALHHLTYEAIRKAEPQLGAQLSCNAIYLASAYLKLAKTRLRARVDSATKPKPDFRSVPVYLDKHTLTMKDRLLSIYTLDGRARLSVSLPSTLEVVFSSTPVKEILLLERQEGFVLAFIFKVPTDSSTNPVEAASSKDFLRQLEEAA